MPNRREVQIEVPTPSLLEAFAASLIPTVPVLASWAAVAAALQANAGFAAEIAAGTVASFVAFVAVFLALAPHLARHPENYLLHDAADAWPAFALANLIFYVLWRLVFAFHAGPPPSGVAIALTAGNAAIVFAQPVFTGFLGYSARKPTRWP